MKLTTSNLARLTAGVSFVILSGMAPATTLIDDPTMATSDWSMTFVHDGNASSITAFAAQTNFFGAPLPARIQMTTLIDGTEDSLSFHSYLPTTLDPGTTSFVNMQFTANVAVNSPALYSFAIAQGGSWFFAGFNSTQGGLGLVQDSGVLVASDFVQFDSVSGGLNLNNSIHPDFSSSGAPIEFGISFFENMSIAEAQTNSAYVFDNFRVELDAIPEPFTIIGFGIASFAGLKIRRKR